MKDRLGLNQVTGGNRDCGRSIPTMGADKDQASASLPWAFLWDLSETDATRTKWNYQNENVGPISERKSCHERAG